MDAILPKPGDRVRLWLDDERPAPEGWFLVKTMPQAVAVIEAAKEGGFTIEAISMDHDLGMPQTGYDFAVWLEREIAYGTIQAPKELACHSANPSGRLYVDLVIQSIKRMTL